MPSNLGKYVLKEIEALREKILDGDVDIESFMIDAGVVDVTMPTDVAIIRAHTGRLTYTITTYDPKGVD